MSADVVSALLNVGLMPARKGSSDASRSSIFLEMVQDGQPNRRCEIRGIRMSRRVTDEFGASYIFGLNNFVERIPKFGF
jgi:hypothetical protein